MSQEPLQMTPLTTPVRWLYIGLGLVLVGVGVVGIFLPLLPSTVFFLGASCFFARSSPRLQRKLLQHPQVGPMVQMAHGRAMPRRAKVLTLAAMWSAILLSSWLSPGWILPLVAVGLGMIGSAVILYWIRTVPVTAARSLQQR
ncbi:MAG: YbaN family protein [Acidobacteriota bacterium]|nr:YbaN family protein [Acidobacteriota bacterium]MDH3784046.1 YbaN family protein [Acidobacteriota bacterium]